jgi:uncharacterized protein
VIDVLVVPRASRERLGPIAGDRIRASVAAPAVEGRANESLVALVARQLGVRKQAVSILAGERGRRKTLLVVGLSRAVLLSLLEGEER